MIANLINLSDETGNPNNMGPLMVLIVLCFIIIRAISHKIPSEADEHPLLTEADLIEGDEYIVLEVNSETHEAVIELVSDYAERTGMKTAPKKRFLHDYFDWEQLCPNQFYVVTDVGGNRKYLRQVKVLEALGLGATKKSPT
jgi:hypothetical protein